MSPCTCGATARAHRISTRPPYAIVVALVAFTMLPPDDPRTVPQIMGIMTNTMLHRIVPAMVVLDFLLFDEHRRLKAPAAAHRAQGSPRPPTA